MKRRLLAMVVLLAVFCMLSGCEPAKESMSTDGQLLLGFSQLGSESAWRLGNSVSIQQAAKDHGIRLMFNDANQSQENQIKAIRSFIAYRVDVIALAPIVEDGWDIVLNEAKQAGIPVILVDRYINTQDETLYVSHIGSDFYQEGIRAGEYLLRKADAMGTDRLNIVEITGTLDSTPMRQRYKGLRDAIGNDGRMTILDSVSGDFLISKGKECMKYLLSLYGDSIDVLYAHNDGMMLGALEAIEEAGYTPGRDIIIISVDAEQKAIDALKAGRVNCVVECSPMIGDVVMQLVRQLAGGGQVERDILTEERMFTEFDDLSDISPRGY